MIIAIDPGVCWLASGEIRAGCAQAWLDLEGRVRGVGFARFGAGLGWAASEVVIERPQFDARSARVRVQDLIALTWDGALLAASYGLPVVWYTPSQWKGSVHKPIQHLTLWESFSADERALFHSHTYRHIQSALERGARSRWAPGKFAYPKSFTGHNLLDAVALGRYHLTQKKRCL